MVRKLLRAPSWSAFALPLLIACTDRGSSPLTTISDSAGIAIVENRITAATPGCRVRERMRIGTALGDSLHALFRVMDSARLDDGSVVILEGTGRVAIYGPDGGFRRAFGGIGGGPGEFRIPVVLAVLAGDTIVVADEAPWRFSFFTKAGEFLRAFEVQPPVFEVAEIGVWPDGRFLIAAPCCRPRGPGEYVPRTFTATIQGRSGATDTLGVFPYDRLGRLGSNVSGRPLFGSIAFIRPHPEGVAYTSSRKAEIELRHEDGAVHRLLRWNWSSDPVVAEDIEAYRDRLAATTGRVPSRLVDLLANRATADSFPALAALHVSREGRIAALRYPRPRDPEGERRWLFFDSNGRLECIATLPRLSVHELGEDYLRGTLQDELGVEYVVDYQVQAPGGDRLR